MVKNKRFHNRPSKRDADLDVELDEYEPSDDSDDDYSDNEKMLLENRTKGRSQNDDEDESEEEVLKIRSSDDDDEDDDKEDGVRPVGSDMDSDIEGKEDNDNLPDPKAWGKRRKDFYHTDYVDEDYGGFTRAEEEEAALLEEKEARVIQERLLAELDDTDFSFGLISQAEKKEEESKEATEEVIKTDLSKMSKREKLALLEKESPEFMGLVSDFKERLLYAKDKLYPILQLVKSGELPDCTAAEFVSTKFHITLNYCTNVAFYLLLKAKRINIQTHPVVKRLVQYRKLLEQLDTIEKDTIKPQIEIILQMKQEGKRISIRQPQEKSNGIIGSGKMEKKRKMLQLLSEKNKESSVVPAKKLKKISVSEQPQKKVHFEDEPENPTEDGDEDIIKNNDYDDDGEDNNDSSEEQNVTVPAKGKGLESQEIGKRGITFEIAKNKGLTPRRKKEQRNPRVKNRNKYRKAKIRRKGQVREPRTEMSRYAGELFGIKASVKKSIKLS